MQIVKLTLTVVAILLLALAPIEAGAQTTYTFEGTNSVYWHENGNWDEPGWPVAGDTAIIPSGKTCRTGDGSTGVDDAAATVQVAGTLIIEGDNVLTISDTLDIDSGATVLFDYDGTVPELHYADGFVIDGEGTVFADAENGESGIIKQFSASAASIEVETDVTLKGSITIFSDHLINNGLLLVDDGEDTMHLGSSGQAEFTDVSGTGTFKVSAGTMAHHKLRLIPQFEGTLEVTGGTMDFTTDKVQTVSSAFVHVSGGVLALNRYWISGRGLQHEGGKISVIEGSTATFNSPE